MNNECCETALNQEYNSIQFKYISVIHVSDLGKKIFDKLHIFEEFSQIVPVWEGKVCLIYHCLTYKSNVLVIISLLHITSYNWTQVLTI